MSDSSLFLVAQGAEGGEDAFALGGEGEAGGDGDAGLRLVAFPVFEEGAGDCFSERSGEVFAAVEVGDQHTDRFIDELERAAGGGADHGGSAGEALEKDKPERFKLGGEDPDVGHVVELRQGGLGVGANEVDVREVEVLCEVLIAALFFDRSGSRQDGGDAQSGIGSSRFVGHGCAQEAIDALDVGELADKEHDPIAA